MFQHIKIIFILLLFVVSKNSDAQQNEFQRVYTALQSDDSAKINFELSSLETTSLKGKDAYTGALTMRKSGLAKSGLEKLSLFKKGRRMLEASIKLDSMNAEYRFLRLIIQEHVPDFLNYHSKKEEDAKMIRESYRKLSPELQAIIKNYSKNSHILKPEDFQK
jgi:hypothetical protein